MTAGLWRALPGALRIVILRVCRMEPTKCAGLALERGTGPIRKICKTTSWCPTGKTRWTIALVRTMASGRIWPTAPSKAWFGIIRTDAESKSRKRIFLESRPNGLDQRMVAPSVDGENTGCLAMQTQLNHDSGRPMVSFSWVISICSKPASDNNEVNRLGVIQL